jgi:hypothetical protein
MLYSERAAHVNWFSKLSNQDKEKKSTEIKATFPPVEYGEAILELARPDLCQVSEQEGSNGAGSLINCCMFPLHKMCEA